MGGRPPSEAEGTDTWGDKGPLPLAYTPTVHRGVNKQADASIGLLCLNREEYNKQREVIYREGYSCLVTFCNFRVDHANVVTTGYDKRKKLNVQIHAIIHSCVISPFTIYTCVMPRYVSI